MKSKFVVPASTMLVSLVGWITFLFTARTALWLGVAVALAAGGLMVFSAVRCHAVGGPRAGNVVRAVLLALMAASAYWRVGVLAGHLLVAAAAGVAVQAAASGPRKAAGDTPASSSAGR